MMSRIRPSLLRIAQSSLGPGRSIGSGKRFITAQPPHLRSRSWKSSAARWGIAIAGIYFYNTSPVFAEEPIFDLHQTADEILEDALPLHLQSPKLHPDAKQRISSKQSNILESATGATPVDSSLEGEKSSSPSTDLTMSQDLEEEASQEGAFNPETGEINWDCPCLGGMAHGPCGEQFRAAFSCFVFSKEEPKGMDCIENFKTMQDCFREHPEVYHGELEDDDDDEEALDEALRDGDAAGLSEADKADLQREVEEKRKAFRERQEHQPRQSETDSTPPPQQKRLLEESPAPTQLPTPPSTPRPSRQRAAAKSVPSQQDHHQQQQQTLAPPSSSEPHPGMSEEHELAARQQQQQQQQQQRKKNGATDSPSSTPTNPFSQDGEKIDSTLPERDTDQTPKPWHDARDGSDASAGTPGYSKAEKSS